MDSSIYYKNVTKFTIIGQATLDGDTISIMQNHTAILINVASFWHSSIRRLVDQNNSCSAPNISSPFLGLQG